MDSFKKHERLRISGGRHLSVGEHTVRDAHPLHWHSYFEIEIVLSGVGKYVINDVAYDISKHNMFFLTPTDFHYLKVEGITRVINISFDEYMIDEKDIGQLVYPQTKKAYAFDPAAYERVLSAAKLLGHECAVEGECQRQLLQYILKCVFRRNDKAPSAISLGGHYKGIKRALAYMEMHFKDDVSLEKIAAEAGYHPAYFSKLFKRITGETYMEALTRLRIGYAKALLANGFAVADACFLSGFGSLSNFFAVFKKNCGISPSTYRERERS